MPIPQPSSGEEQKKYISRCMGNPTMRKEFPEQKDRAGVCYSTWRKKKKEIKPETEVVRIGKEKVKAMKFINFKALRFLKKHEAPGDNQPVTPTPTKGETKDAFVGRCMKRLKSRQSKEVVPARMKARCVASWAKAHGGKNMSGEGKMSASKILKEAFQSLQQALRKAVEAQPGRNYLADFSTKEVIYSTYEENSEEKYFKVKYVVKNGEVEFDGTPERVERKITFEGEVKTIDLIRFAELENDLEE